ncbi:MAG: hypothetical protein CMB82_12495 [Flammeovirgaceae bacterium]|nr:hypothetical protein [Flammeovirgaceae bacterium]
MHLIILIFSGRHFANYLKILLKLRFVNIHFEKMKPKNKSFFRFRVNDIDSFGIKNVPLWPFSYEILYKYNFCSNT